jgi:hypothetical protein
LEYIAHYLSPEKNATRIYFRDERPVVVHKTESYVSAPDVSLISAWLTSNFSFYAAVTGIFAVIAVLILVAPFVTNERSRKMQYLQYSSSIGRKLFRTQFAVSVVAATLAGAAIIAVLYGLCFAQTNIEDYLNCSTALHTNDGFYMYDVTFGQYVVILAAMTLLLCICAACLAFVLGRFSSNAVNLMLKTVPVGAAVATIAALAMNRLFSPSNYVFNNLFTNRLNIEYMEVIICAMLALIGAVVEAVVMVREKRVDVA